MCDELYQKPARLRSHTNDSCSFFGALGFTVPVEELTLKMASLAKVLDWLTQPQGPHLVDGTSTREPLMALAILITPEALYDHVSPMVGLGFVYKAPYIQATSWSEAYFNLKLASQAEASNRTTGTKIIFVQIQESSQVIPLPGVPTLFLDVKTPEDITCKLLFFLLAVCWFSCSFVSKVCASLGNGCERFCVSRSLLGSYVHQESIKIM